MNQPQPVSPSKPGNDKTALVVAYIFWGLITIGLLYLEYKTLLCEQFSFIRRGSTDAMYCGSDSAGIPTAIGLVFLGLWTLFSLILFIKVNKILAYIFGGLFFIEIAYLVITIIT